MEYENENQHLETFEHLEIYIFVGSTTLNGHYTWFCGKLLVFISFSWSDKDRLMIEFNNLIVL